jgi:DNA-directed RNA polymerase specialized sigma subunit
MIKSVKKHLKTLSREEIKQAINHPDITEIEKWLIYYTYAENRMVINTCYKLGLSEAQFHITQKIALTKLYYILGL